MCQRLRRARDAPEACVPNSKHVVPLAVPRAPTGAEKRMRATYGSKARARRPPAGFGAAPAARREPGQVWAIKLPTTRCTPPGPLTRLCSGRRIAELIRYARAGRLAGDWPAKRRWVALPLGVWRSKKALLPKLAAPRALHSRRFAPAGAADTCVSKAEPSRRGRERGARVRWRVCQRQPGAASLSLVSRRWERAHLQGRHTGQQQRPASKGEAQGAELDSLDSHECV